MKEKYQWRKYLKHQESKEINDKYWIRIYGDGLDFITELWSSDTFITCFEWGFSTPGFGYHYDENGIPVGFDFDIALSFGELFLDF